MTSKTNTENKPNHVVINGKEYYRLRKRVGMTKNKRGEWRPRYQFFYGKTKKEATAKYEAYIRKSSFEADKPLGELMDQFIDSVLMPDSSLKATTKSRYVNAYYNCFKSSKLSEMPLSEITGFDIQAAINNAPVAPSSVKQACNLLKRFYKYVSSQHIAADVTSSLVLPDVSHRRTDQTISTFTDQELKQFIERTPTDHRLRFLIILGINTGCRIAELLALKYSDFQGDNLIINKALAEIDPIRDPDSEQDQRDITRAEIITTKSQTSNRSVPINDDVMAALADHKKWHTAEMENNGYNSPYVFTTSSGSLYFKSSVRTAFKRLCAQIDVPPRGFHCFRKTFGTKLASAGVPIQTLCSIMGHSDISVTARYYVNVPTDEKKSAIGKLKLY